MTWLRNTTLLRPAFTLLLAAGLVAACGGGPATPPPTPAPTGAASAGGGVSMHPFSGGGWQVDINGKGWYPQWLPGGRLLLQVSVGAPGSVVEVDPAKGEARAWPAVPEHMMLASSPDGTKAAWPEKTAGGHRVMVGGSSGPAQPVGSEGDDIYQVAWLGNNALLIERPAGVQLVVLSSGKSSVFSGRRLMQVAGNAALLSDNTSPTPQQVVTAAGTSKDLPRSTLFAALSPDGNRMVWAPNVTPPPVASTWFDSGVVLAHGALAAYARELRLVDLASGKEIAVALPSAAFIDASAWNQASGELALAVHASNDASGFPKGPALLRVSAAGKVQRFETGAAYFELGGYVGDRVVVFAGDAKDFSKLTPLAFGADGQSKRLATQPVQYVDDPLAPWLVFAAQADITLVERKEGKRLILPRKDVPKGTNLYPPEWSPDGRWATLRSQGQLLLLPAEKYAAPAL